MASKQYKDRVSVLELLHVLGVKFNNENIQKLENIMGIYGVLWMVFLFCKYGTTVSIKIMKCEHRKSDSCNSGLRVGGKLIKFPSITLLETVVTQFSISTFSSPVIYVSSYFLYC